ncbi:MAG: DUF3352 domain-containing protein [Acidothermaceae bacterium]
MTDHEPRDERAQFDGGAAAAGEQPDGDKPAQQPYGQVPQQPYGQAPQQPDGQAPQLPYQPPAYGQPTPAAPGSSMPFGTADILAAGRPQAPKRRLAPIVTSVAVVLAIVLGGGAFTAMKLLASSGSQPDKWAPANSIAFAKLDLDPSASAKVAAWEFEQKFPQAPKIANADQLKDGLLSAAFKDADQIDYATDVKPWLGDRVAMAVFLDASGKPEPIYILQVKNDAQAKAGLNKIIAAAGVSTPTSGDVTAFSIQGGYAVLGENQTVVDDAIAQAKKADISTNANYTSDIAQLKSDRVVTTWWDLGATLKAVSSDLPGQASALLLSGGLTGLPDMTKAGRFVMGLRVQPTYVEMQGRVLGSSASSQLKDGDAGTALGNLPGGTVAGVALANPEQLVKTELDQLKKGLAGTSMQTEFDQLGAQLGVSIPGDIENLLGSQLAVGVDALPANFQQLGQTFITAMTHPDDLAKAKQTAQILLSNLGPAAGDALKISTQGQLLVGTDDPKVASGKLSESPAYRAALDGMPSQAVAAGYVDLSSIIAAEPDAPSSLAPLQSIGFYYGNDSTSPVFSVRLTVK